MIMNIIYIFNNFYRLYNSLLLIINLYVKPNNLIIMKIITKMKMKNILPRKKKNWKIIIKF